MAVTTGFDVIVIGGANTDFLVRGKSLPKPGSTVDGEAFQEASGGKGTNQAVAAARLGARVALVARVGSDVRGNAILHSMSETIFTCPMHPEVQARAPGSCPKCGMKLEPKGPVRRDMRWRSSAFAWPFWFAIAVAACGGSQPPAESPEQTPSSPGPSTDADEADAAPEGEHTMPDGTTMPGDHHEHDSSSPATDETTE